MAKRKTMGSNPLDAVVPRQKKESESHNRNGASQSQSEPGDRVVKERLTVHIPINLIDRVKNVVYWTPGLTLARLAEEALAIRVEKLEKERGGAYPPRREELKGGRPLK